jgi:hypothetical protein
VQDIPHPFEHRQGAYHQWPAQSVDRWIEERFQADLCPNARRISHGNGD